ncbi:TetR/AcrR family transcriptional regulator [Solihabitans fulvus]|uniref:TetR/AcrR family transcriptional regulator n=1 Tax=Solihabitans fulvus TaxID=1892852 RepID=A0A5B2XW50_9PSEU|nr:TetR/AcrR family transcriptional regulator [Solihabitans fulvus]KAA2267112.1 TetR/AcrR family transcriptional regulator [Solihabitans fulvus]
MSTRDRMVDAAAHVMRTRGLARATTKEIAREAGYSEAALYRHFRDKTDLFVAVLTERVPSTLGPVLGGLTGRVGQGSVLDTVTEVARAAIGFYELTFPMAASVYSEPELLTAHRAALRERNAGPHLVGDALAGYLAAEQRLGRVHRDADPRAAAELLIGACLHHAFISSFSGEPGDADAADRAAAALVRTLMGGLDPQRPDRPDASRE